VATGKLIDEDPTEALAHAVAARRLASRIAAVREAVGLAAYHAGEWQTAIAELRTYHRMSGTQTHLAVVADSERALGRPERAIDLFRAADRSTMDPGEAVELLIVAAGARSDLDQKDAAVAMLQVRELTAEPAEPWTARLRYAYADMLLAVDRRDEAREWFARAAEVDEDSTTDAAERLLELDGVVLEGDEDEFDEDEAGYDADAEADVEDEDEDDEADADDEFEEGEASYDEDDEDDDYDEDEEDYEDTIADADADDGDGADTDEDVDAALDDEADEDGVDAALDDEADEDAGAAQDADAALEADAAFDADAALEADARDVGENGDGDADGVDGEDDVVTAVVARGEGDHEDVVEDKVAEDEFAYAAEDDDAEKPAGTGGDVKAGESDKS
jgi:tetratricopeptide (TPR) repeat protein